MPTARAASVMRRAMATRSSAAGRMPRSSMARPTMAAPYFLHRGRIASSFSCSPLVELTMGLPLYTRRPFSSACTLEESSCSGRLVTLCRALTTLGIRAGSSTPGAPTFTSST